MIMKCLLCAKCSVTDIQYHLDLSKSTFLSLGKEKPGKQAKTEQ